MDVNVNTHPLHTKDWIMLVFMSWSWAHRYSNHLGCVLLPLHYPIFVHITFSGVPCRYTEHGTEYSGTINVTVTGIKCQRWDTDSPHYNNHPDPAYYPEDTLGEAENYCRNPDGHHNPWCYTTDISVRWDNCDIPFCSMSLWIPLTESLYCMNCAGLTPIQPFQLPIQYPSRRSWWNVNSNSPWAFWIESIFNSYNCAFKSMQRFVISHCFLWTVLSNTSQPNSIYMRWDKS